MIRKSATGKSRRRNPDSKARAQGRSRPPARSTDRARSGRSARSRLRTGPPRPQPSLGSRTRPVGTVDAILGAQAWDSLIPHLLRAGADDPERAVERLRDYARLLIEWNRSVSNLISGNDEPRILERHIREALEPGYWLRETGGRRWLDFGAGAGLPGIPLAIAGIGERWTLVESRRPKVLFMRKAVESLGLKGIDIYHGRLEAFVDEASGDRVVDGLVSRATLKLAPTLEIAQQVVVKGGHAFLWKGSRRDEESASESEWGRDWELTGILGVGDGQTAVLRFVRRE